MKKILIFLIVVAGLAMLEPRSRTRIITLITPISEASYKRTAAREVEQIALAVVRAEARTGGYPQPGGFGNWLTENDRSAQDPWGSGYYLELFADSFVVGSPGGDAQRRTADDIRAVEHRQATAAGLGSAFTPPAPPASSTKSRATRAAAEAARKGTGQ